MSTAITGPGWSHSRTYAQGGYVEHHGPLYDVTIEYSETDNASQLFVDVGSTTLTADQAEVLGRALIAAADLRMSRRVATEVRFEPYWPATGYVHPSPEVVAPTAAEQEVAAAGR